MKRKAAYIALSVIFALSLAVALLAPARYLRVAFSIPACAALVAVIFQILRERLAHERALLLLEAQNSFSLGATSHMASVAFDKHVGFCEEYVGEMHRLLSTLFVEGPTERALQHSTQLYKVREKWVLWVTPEIEKQLERFEQAVREIGAHAHLVDQVPGQQTSVQRMYSLFAQVVGWKEWEGAPLTAELAMTTVIARLRNVLGIEELTALRTRLVSRALDQLNAGPQSNGPRSVEH